MDDKAELVSANKLDDKATQIEVLEAVKSCFNKDSKTLGIVLTVKLNKDYEPEQYGIRSMGLDEEGVLKLLLEVVEKMLKSRKETPDEDDVVH